MNDVAQLASEQLVDRSLKNRYQIYTGSATISNFLSISIRRSNTFSALNGLIISKKQIGLDLLIVTSEKKTIVVLNHIPAKRAIN